MNIGVIVNDLLIWLVNFQSKIHLQSIKKNIFYGCSYKIGENLICKKFIFGRQADLQYIHCVLNVICRKCLPVKRDERKNFRIEMFDTIAKRDNFGCDLCGLNDDAAQLFIRPFLKR